MMRLLRPAHSGFFSRSIRLHSHVLCALIERKTLLAVDAPAKAIITGTGSDQLSGNPLARRSLTLSPLAQRVTQRVGAQHANAQSE